MYKYTFKIFVKKHMFFKEKFIKKKRKDFQI